MQLEYQKEKQGKGTEEVSDIIVAENFPKLKTDTKLQIQEFQRTVCT